MAVSPNLTFLQWMQPFCGTPQSHGGSIIRPLITVYIYALGGNRSSRNLCALKQNFSPLQKKAAFFSTRKRFLTTKLDSSALINGLQQLDCVPRFHPIGDEQLRNVWRLTSGDKVGAGEVLRQHETLEYSKYSWWRSLKYRSSLWVHELFSPFFF